MTYSIYTEMLQMFLLQYYKVLIICILDYNLMSCFQYRWGETWRFMG